jgi:hypothetical protein
MKLVSLILVTPLMVFGIGCSRPAETDEIILPAAFVANSGDTVRFGEPIPGWSAGTRIVAFKDLRLPDGTTEVYVEADAAGRAHAFEFLYPPDASFDDVRRYYEKNIGAANGYFERVAGYCNVWEYTGRRFELCSAREPSDGPYGLVVARLLAEVSV